MPTTRQELLYWPTEPQHVVTYNDRDGRPQVRHTRERGAKTLIKSIIKHGGTSITYDGEPK